MKRKLLALIMTAAVLLTAVSCGRKIEQDPVSGAQGTASGTQGAAENEDLEASVRVTYEALTGRADGKAGRPYCNRYGERRFFIRACKNG